MTFFQQLHHIDKDVTLAINSFNSPASDFTWQVFSNKYIWFVLYGVVIFFFFRNLGWKRALIVIVGVALAVTCCDQFANFTKAYFERLRPCWDGGMVGLHLLEDKGNLYGFYSAHAANSMTFAVGSYIGFKNDTRRNYKPYGICVIIWAILVGMSRVFCGKHFFGDVCVGYAVGVIVALFFSLLSVLLIKKFNLQDK